MLALEAGAQAASVAADVVAKALAFKASLSSSQQTTLQKTYSPALARNWSNLPGFACENPCRNGVEFKNLSAKQLGAALDVIKAAAGKAVDEGSDEFIQITQADSVLDLDANPGDFSKGFYYISFLNAPSATSGWMLQFGGHHAAANISFNGGKVLSPTPEFKGVEPADYVDKGGRKCQPLTQEHDAFAALLASLSADELAAAKVAGPFPDVVLGPGKDNNWPAKAGIKAGGLTALQQSLVLKAMDPYLNDADSATAASFRAIYESELADTYIAYKGKDLKADGDYVRLDGPSVWLEFVVQNGVVYADRIHYHSVWRDRNRDYGKDLKLEPAAVKAPGRQIDVRFSASADRNFLHLPLHKGLRHGSVIIRDGRGRQVMALNDLSGSDIKIDIARLPRGIYSVEAKDGVLRMTSCFASL
jgi:hypothetical protein